MRTQGTPLSATYLPAICEPAPAVGDAGPSSGLACMQSLGLYNVGLSNCVYAPLPEGTTLPCGVCDGSGFCRPLGSFLGGGPTYALPLPAFCPAKPSECVNEGSIDLLLGECAYVNLPAGTACSAGTCDGAGNCGTASPDAGANAGTVEAARCDDGLPCTGDTVAADGTCAHYPVRDGTQCNDGAFCDIWGTCAAGVCTGITQWPSGFVCPGGACDGNSNCVSQDCTANPDGTPCNDGDTCDQPGVCAGGACTGTAPMGGGTSCPGGTCDGKGTCVVPGSSGQPDSGSEGGGSGGSGSGGSGSGVSSGSSGGSGSGGSSGSASGSSGSVSASSSGGSGSSSGGGRNTGSPGSGSSSSSGSSDSGSGSSSSGGSTGCVPGNCPCPPGSQGNACPDPNVCDTQGTCDANELCLPGEPIAEIYNTNAGLDNSGCIVFSCDGSTGSPVFTSRNTADGTSCVYSPSCEWQPRRAPRVRAMFEAPRPRRERSLGLRTATTTSATVKAA